MTHFIDCQAEIAETYSKIETAYTKTIMQRANTENFSRTLIEVCFEGNNAFKEVYNSVWENTIENAEQHGQYFLCRHNFPPFLDPWLS